MNAVDHWGLRYECDTCDRKFSTQRSANLHMDDTGHREPEFECETCDTRFRTQISADQHMDALEHYKQHYCNSCSSKFQSENALKMHLNSSIHRGNNITCPFCKSAFTTASGLSHHLESSSCQQAKNIDHRTIFKAIRQHDCRGLFTNNLLTYPDFDTQNIATRAAWNGSSFECYLCHREYNTLRALNQHLNSPAHSEKLYHCPNRSCNRQFGRLASLFNHLESESCNFVRFEKVQKYAHTFIKGRQKLLGFVCCQDHFNQPEMIPTQCNPPIYGGKIASPGLCSSCLSDDSMQPEKRMRQFPDMAEWKDHINNHHSAKSLACPLNNIHCGASFEPLQDLEFPLEDVHCVDSRRTFKKSRSAGDGKAGPLKRLCAAGKHLSELNTKNLRYEFYEGSGNFRNKGERTTSGRSPVKTPCFANSRDSSPISDTIPDEKEHQVDTPVTSWYSGLESDLEENLREELNEDAKCIIQTAAE